MQLSKHIRIAILSAMTFFELGQIHGEPLDLNFTLSNGYRQDRISTSIDIFNPAKRLVMTEHLKADKMHLYEVGGKARFGACDYRVKADAFWGWGTSGNYVCKAQEEELLPGYIVPPRITRAGINNTSTQDFTIGAGYLFTLGQFFEVTPMAGLSYHSQRMKLHNAQTNGHCNYILDGLRYRNQWQGPWAGVDALFTFCDFVIQGGYEYHWADWRGRWKLHGPNIYGVAFSDKRKSDHVRGQVGYVDVRWNFCECWEAGIGVKGGIWKARNGHLKPRKIKVSRDCSDYYSGSSGDSSSRRDRRKARSRDESNSRYDSRYDSSYDYNDGGCSDSSDCSSEYSVISQSFGDVGFGKNEVDNVDSAKWDTIRVTFDIGCYF